MMGKIYFWEITMMAIIKVEKTMVLIKNDLTANLHSLTARILWAPELYRSIHLSKPLGMWRWNQMYAGSENRIIYGVVNVVSVDTATATGYKNPLVTLRVSPSVAIMNENSPI